MNTARYSVVTLPEFIGREVARSDWIEVTQATIDAFAHATGDHQWIHVDVERAKRESPYGSTIAHGYLTLSLVAGLVMTTGVIPADAQATFNYGIDKVRFIAPVKAGARIRATVELAEVTDQGGGRCVIKMLNHVEIDGEAKPALIAETLAMIVGPA